MSLCTQAVHKKLVETFPNPVCLPDSVNFASLVSRVADSVFKGHMRPVGHVLRTMILRIIYGSEG